MLLVDIQQRLNCFTVCDTAAELQASVSLAFLCPGAHSEQRGMPQQHGRSIAAAVSFIWFEVYILPNKHLVCGLTTRVVSSRFLLPAALWSAGGNAARQLPCNQITF